LGEVCHFVDLAQYIAGCRPERVYAETPGEGSEDETVTASIRFGDTVASISYLTQGNPSLPKEYLEVYGRDSIGVIRDFKEVELIRDRKTRRIKKRRVEKGYREELEAFFTAVQGIVPPPIPFEEMVYSTKATMAIRESISTGYPVKIN
jgi:predicted dehydrogenase